MSNPACGAAYQFNWTKAGNPSVPAGSRFVANPSGLDLNGSENSYAAIIATTGGSCNTYVDTAIHELAHLLGTGHEYPTVADLDCCLNNDSHAGVYTTTLPWPPAVDAFSARAARKLAANLYAAKDPLS